ncbi:hypothetical protein HPB50_002450 [Hyalomma asiaticum]|uniref:Uncharacterized protein n=1 Tax=Hyalomma asiaticum TaxID=266040 RepID=A0ACB7RRW3_HYAAI|nr:hypothetical protein HPB50_002450 [Hyalomma asiaticum]
MSSVPRAITNDVLVCNDGKANSSGCPAPMFAATARVVGRQLQKHSVLRPGARCRVNMCASAHGGVSARRKDSSHKKWLFSSVVSGLPLVTYGACVEFSALKFGGRSPHRKDAVQADAGGYQVLGDVRLPDKVAHLLKKGPKFSTEPSIPAHELLASNRRISRKAVLEDQERCLLDGVDSLRRTVTKNSPTSSALIKKTVSFFKDNELRLLLSDKEGNFVVAPSAVFKDKAIRAVNKNFFPSTVKALKEADGSIFDDPRRGRKNSRRRKECKVAADSPHQPEQQHGFFAAT